jgi:hypothetical protein
MPGACTSVLVRSPVPEAALEEARPYGIEAQLIRIWGDTLDPGTVESIVALRARALEAAHRAQIAEGETVRMASLALSGGGADGAFGAGLLAGWTARGDRPRFKTVTGVSTGAIIAVFAFLCPEHAATLREIYTQYASEDLFAPAILAGLRDGPARHPPLPPPHRALRDRGRGARHRRGLSPGPGPAHRHDQSRRRAPGDLEYWGDRRLGPPRCAPPDP